MNIEIKPHTEINARGEKSSADCYPFLNGEPCSQIASCGHCKLNREDQDYCAGWNEDRDNAPLFCGPICQKFDPNEEAIEKIEAILIG